MHLRVAVPADLPAIANVAALAMLDDELFAVICPRRREYYSDYRASFLQRLRMKLASLGWVVVVAVEGSTPQSEDGELVGYSVWERIGDSESARRWKEDGPWNVFERTLLNATNKFCSIICPDRSVDNSRLAEYNGVGFPFSEFPDLWFLSTLAVRPDRQRRGIGRTLVEWGLDQASRDAVPIGLEASAEGTGLYEKLGFRVVNEIQCFQTITIRAMLRDN